MPINFDVSDPKFQVGKVELSPNEKGQFTPIKIDLLDVDKARERFFKYSEHIAQVQKRVSGLEIKTGDHQYEMVEIVNQAKVLLKKLDDQRKAVIEKPNSFVRTINAYVKGFKDQIEEVIRTGKKKLDDYAYLELVKKQQEEKRLAEEQMAREKEIKKAAEKAGVPAPELPKPVVNKKPGPVRTESGSASSVMVWVWEIDDESKIPREYLAVDDKKINSAVKAGIREIPGVKIEQRAETRFRRS